MTSGISAGRTWAAKALGLVETPKGSLCWENLCGCMGRLVGGTDWGDCGRKVSTQRKYACVFAGSDVLGKCKRITLTLSSVLTYRCMYVSLCIMHGRRQRGQGATAAPPPFWRVGRVSPPLLWTSPSRRLHFIYFDFKSRPPHFKIASFAYVYTFISRDIHGLQLVWMDTLEGHGQRMEEDMDIEWPIHGKIIKEPTHQKRNLTKSPVL